MKGGTYGKKQLAASDRAATAPMQETLPEQATIADPTGDVGLTVEAEQGDEANQTMIQDVLAAQNQESGQEQILTQATEQPSVGLEDKR